MTHVMNDDFESSKDLTWKILEGEIESIKDNALSIYYYSKGETDLGDRISGVNIDLTKHENLKKSLHSFGLNKGSFVEIAYTIERGSIEYQAIKPHNDADSVKSKFDKLSGEIKFF